MIALRLVGYLWTLPNSLIGLFLAVFSGQRARWRDGALEVEVRWIAAQRWYPLVAGQTWGWVVLLKPSAPGGITDALRAHEHRHVAQGMVFGPLFLVLYPLASLWALMLGRDPYRENAFEVDARRAAEIVKLRLTIVH